MSVVVIIALWIIIVFHFLAFAGEAFFWMRPALHRGMIRKVNPGLEIDPLDQARATRVLMINQGVYNLMIALGGLLSLIIIGNGDMDAGRTLAFFICVFAAVAGITLAATTTAYAGAVLQALPGLVGAVILLL